MGSRLLRLQVRRVQLLQRHPSPQGHHKYVFSPILYTYLILLQPATTTTTPAAAPKPAVATPATTTATTFPAAQQSWNRPVPVLTNQILPQYAATQYATQTGPAPVPRRVLRELVYGFESDVKVDADAEQVSPDP